MVHDLCFRCGRIVDGGVIFRAKRSYQKSSDKMLAQAISFSGVHNTIPSGDGFIQIVVCCKCLIEKTKFEIS